jgi:hypothetical protein
VLLDLGDHLRVRHRHTEEELTLDEVAFEPNGNLGPSRLGDSHEFGDRFFGNVESVDKDRIIGIEFARVVTQKLGELGNSRVKHVAT